MSTTRQRTEQEVIAEIEALPGGPGYYERLSSLEGELAEIRSTPRQPDIVAPESGGSAEAGYKCASCGAAASDSDAVFCSKCGERLIDEEAAALAEAVRDALETHAPALVQREMRALSDRMKRLERQRSSPAERPFLWDRLPNSEKWNVSWGVFWRVLLIQLCIWIVFLVIASSSQ